MEPSQFVPPPEPVAPPSPRSRRWPLVLASVILLFAVGGIGFGLGRASVQGFGSDFTVSGTMSASGCGSGGYSDIRVGAQVEITNQANDVLGVSVLNADKGYCEFKFSVTGVPSGEKLYGVHIGNANRGVIWKSEEEAKTEGFHLTLGD